jgi:LacI family transcriptional regulator
MTLEEIAELASVSRSTVSRVLNNHPNVRASVRERVLEIMQQQGYVPNAAARSLASRRTQVIGLLIPRSAAVIFADPFFAHVIHSITETCANYGYFLMLSMVTVDREQGFYERILRSRHFDGVIMLSSDIDDPILPLLMKDETPLVLFGSHPYFHNVAWVDADQREGARRAIHHLLSLGHRRIATITGPLQMQAAIERRDGYKQGMLEAGLPIMPHYMVSGNWTEQGAYQAMKELLYHPQKPTAIFVASDSMALGAIRALNEAGCRIPDDMAIVSFDDLVFAAYANPPLTTVRQPIPDMGATAVRLLLDQVEKMEKSTEHVLLPTELMIRASCGMHVSDSFMHTSIGNNP